MMMKRNVLTALALMALPPLLQATEINIPYASSLYEDTEWTVVNVNPDSRTWRDSSSSYDFSNSGYKEGKYYSYDYYEPADDWLISPAITLEAGKEYKVSFSYRCSSKREKLELRMGEGNDIEMLKEGEQLFDYDGSTTSFKKSVNVIRPVENKTLYFGIHAYSPANIDYIYVTGFEIKENVFQPAPISGLQSQIAPNEELRCDLSWTLPTTDIDGAALTPDYVFNNVTVYRDNIKIASLDGNATSFSDSPLTGLEAGVHVYSVTVTINGIESAPVECTSLFIGPIPPKELPWTAGIKDLSKDTFAQEWRIIKGEESEVRSDYGWTLSYGQLQFGPGFSGIDEDDWLIMPKINFPKPGAYKLSYRGSYSGSKPAIDMHIAKSSTIEDLSANKIGQINKFESYSSNNTHDIIFLVEEPGSYFVALHACRKDISSYARYYFYEIEFSETEIRPLPVTDLTVEANGDDVTLNWSMPELNNASQTISTYDRVDVYRDNECVKSFEEVTAGSAMEYIDQPGSGVFTYKVIPVLSGKEPEEDGMVVSTGYVGNKVQAIPFVLDFNQDLNTLIVEVLWETINVKKDNYEWKLQDKGWTLNLDSYGGSTNDALLTPPFALEPGVYTISLSARGATNNYPLCIGFIDENSFNQGTNSFKEIERIALNGSSSTFKKYDIGIELNVNTIGRFVIFTDPSAYYDEYPYDIVINRIAVSCEPFQSTPIPYTTNTFEDFIMFDCDEEKDYCWTSTEEGLIIDTDGWDSDDWAVSPIFAFEEGKVYTISFMAEVNEGKFEVYAGKGLKLESMEEVPLIEISEDGNYTIYVSPRQNTLERDAVENNFLALPSSKASLGVRAVGQGSKGKITSLSIVENNQTGLSNIKTDSPRNYELYDLTGNKINNPVKGSIYIIRYSDGEVRKIMK